jgi:Ca-activated chloride channel family protein
MRLKLFLFAIAIIALSLPFPARADGVVIPEPPICIEGSCPPPPCPDCPSPSPMVQLAIRYHHVSVSIRDQVAVTRVDQVFYNPNDWQVEGIYLFPLPPGAAVASFTLWVDGEPVEGEILDADRARQTYQEIVRTMQDPALLEYVGSGAVRASIFPIPPQGERRIELEYSQVLEAENGLVRYVYPLSTEKFSVQPLENVAINVEIESSVPIRAVYSPTHEIAINRESAGKNHRSRARAGYEEANVLPTSDFALYYSIGESEAFHLLTYRDPTDPTDPDGFFLLLLGPRPGAEAVTLSKDVILVLDRSGSMEGEKFQQAQEALRYILGHLNPEDRFNLIAFSTGVESYASGLRPASEANEALPWVDRLSAEGSTDINRALLEAAALVSPSEEGARPTYLIFLTDGLPTEGVIDSQEILENFSGAAPAGLRLFSFGVGYDVDTLLLDSLSQAHHGASSYVLPGERLDEALSAFYAKISTPVLTDLALDFGASSGSGFAAYDLYPSPLPDLFAGSQIVVAGRYRQGGKVDVTLTGNVNAQPQTFRYPDQHFALQSSTSNQQSAIPRLWATRKIGHLLNQVRLSGANQEIIDQIVRLSIRYGIVTPYTSYLVTEPLPLGAAEQERIAADEYKQALEMPAAPASGQDAVEQAADQGALSAAEAPAALDQQSAGRVRIVGPRTFILSDGVWVDTAYDPIKMQTQKVAFLSEDYFTLAEARPDLAAAFALGKRVIALSEGVAYEIVEPGEAADEIHLPAAQSPVGEVDPHREQVPYQQSTPAPATMNEPESTSKSSGLNCGAGLLPLVVLPLAALSLRRRF